MSGLATPFRRTGVEALAAGRLADAVAALEQALRLDPGGFEAWCYLGATYAAQTDHQRARRAFGRALQIRQTDARAWYNMGVAHHRAGDDDAARTCFESAIQNDSGHALSQQALQLLKPHPTSMAELASVGGNVRLAGAHAEHIEDEAPVTGGRTMSAGEMSRLATPEGDMHVPGTEHPKHPQEGSE